MSRTTLGGGFNKGEATNYTNYTNTTNDATIEFLFEKAPGKPLEHV